MISYKNDRRALIGWGLYDWANSVFGTTVLAVLLPVFFAQEVVPDAGVVYLGQTFGAESLWGLLRGGGAFLLFLLTPLLGAVADFSASKRRFLGVFAYGGSVVGALLVFVGTGDVALTMLLFLVANMGFVGSTVFYDGFLPDLTTVDTIDRVSARGFAMGYASGGIHLVVSLALIAKHDALGIDGNTAVRIAIGTAALWWAVFTFVSLRFLPETGTRRPVPPRLAHLPALVAYTRIGVSRTWTTARRLIKFPHLLLFLIAYMIYNDGVSSINALAAVYAGETLELSQQSILVMFIAAQLFALPGALVFGWLAGRTSTRRAILVALVGWVLVSIGAYRLGAGQANPFIMFGALAGLVQGGSSSLSRSLYGSMIPEEASAEFFGFFSVFTKFSSIWGPLLFAFVGQATGSARLAILSISGMFIVGGVLLALVDVDEARASRDRWQFDENGAAAGSGSQSV